MGMSVGALDHFNIRTRKLDDTVRFYEDVMGLEKGAAAELRVPRRLDVQRGQGGGAYRRYLQDRRSRRSRIPAWSITSPLPAAASTA